MAYESKVAQRLAGSTNYKASEGTLTSNSVSEKSMPKTSGSGFLYGKLETGGRSAGKALYGSFVTDGSPSTIAGDMTDSGFTYPREKKYMEPGELKPGTAAQKNNTIRMKPGTGDKSPVMKVTSKTPKELRGGRVR